METFPLFPPRASALASRVDILFFSWLALAAVVATAIFLLIVVFAIRYRHGARVDRMLAPRTERLHRSHWIEVAWIAIPLCLFGVMYVWGAVLYYDNESAPANATPVYAVGKQWMWTLEHTGGRREINELHVPAGRPIKLVMTSQDVIHSFFLPVFRIKQDVLPGRYTTLWFTATKTGDYHFLCTQYCGTDHARMIGHVVVMEPAAFGRWMAGGIGQETMATRGAALFRQFGCSGCHAAGASVHAPGLEGLFGKTVQLQDGSTVVADERYIHDSVLLPRKDITAGYAPIMPSFEGQIDEAQLLDIIEYIKSLRSDG